MPNESNADTNANVALNGRWLVSLADLDKQQKYIAGLRPEVSYMVEGCAGSGKSVLSMIKFNQLILQGSSPVYATMMRGLTDSIIGEMLANTDEAMRPARDYINANTKRKQSGLAHGKPWYFDSHCIGTLAQLPCVAPCPRCPLKGNALVLDECQDLSFGDFQKIANASYSPVCWYGDDDQQLCDTLDDGEKHVRLHEIFDRCFPEDETKAMWFKLSWNYRISPKVARFIDEFQKVVPEERKQLALSARGKRTDKPYLCGYATLEEEIDSMLDVIVNRGWNENLQSRHSTAILVGGSNQQVESLYGLVKRKLTEKVGERNVNVDRRHGDTRPEANDWVTADPGAAIVVSSPLSSKGCQFDSVFVLANTYGTDNGRRLSPRDLNAIHVAMTRSGGELFVFYVGTMPPAFDQIPLSLYEASVDAPVASADDMGLD